MMMHIGDVVQGGSTRLCKTKPQLTFTHLLVSDVTALCDGTPTRWRSPRTCGSQDGGGARATLPTVLRESGDTRGRRFRIIHVRSRVRANGHISFDVQFDKNTHVDQMVEGQPHLTLLDHDHFKESIRAAHEALGSCVSKHAFAHILKIPRRHMQMPSGCVNMRLTQVLKR